VTFVFYTMFSICQGAKDGIEPSHGHFASLLHCGQCLGHFPVLPLHYIRHVLLSYSTLLLSSCQAPFLEKSFLMQVYRAQEFASNSAAAVCPKLLVVKNLERTFPFRLLSHHPQRTHPDYSLPKSLQESYLYHDIQYSYHYCQSIHHKKPYPAQSTML